MASSGCARTYFFLFTSSECSRAPFASDIHAPGILHLLFIIMRRLWTWLVSLFQTVISSFFAWIYDRIEEPAAISDKRRELLDAVEANSKVLEIGAGTGATLACSAYDGDTGRFASLTMAEPDSGMRARLNARLKARRQALGARNISVVDAALPSLPFEDASFDAVVYFLVHSHVADRSSAVKEIVRVLAPSGLLLFIDHGAHPSPHSHSHGSHGGEGHSHPRPFFLEWFTFKKRRTRHEDLSLDLVLEEFKNEPNLEQLFETRMEVDFFVKHIVCSCFKRRVDDVDDGS
ncbi:putative methyltransferase YcgJ [Gracilariopsis chorda]|uniref:Putative methyltransferase YcgJ n=1 Tax=Gracilariopsis chorda TaxID=448386 RepID=A0A2V3IUB6_9FLOR|nr:putative methyltransferase YcgJ [Gracilariopsis chorda]|eukprot:PXF45703.1 putative methyltransferase YcgJ [Gracilariopsis chorda]